MALWARPSEGHNKSQTTNIYNTNVNVNLSGAFDTVFAFGDSNTDNGNARLMGNLQGFVGAWLNTLQGASAYNSGTGGAGAGGSASAGVGGGAGGSASASGGAGAAGNGGSGGSFSYSWSSNGGGASAPASGSGQGSGSGSGTKTVRGNGLTNGKLVIDHLCEALGIPPIPPYHNHSADFSNGANFALAGSTALPGSFFLHNNLLSLMWKTAPQSFDTQLQWFNNFIQNFKKGAKTNMNSTLFWLGGVGTSDYARIHKVATFSSDWLTQQAIDHVSKFIQGIVNQGAKYVVVQGLPPVGCLPLDLMMSSVTERDQNGCAAKINQAVMKHNELLQQKLGELQKSFPQCVFIYADFWKAYMKVLSQYHQFGFTEPFKACCGGGNSHFNFNLKNLCGTPGTNVCADAAKHMIWDGIHFTSAMHNAITKLFIQGGCTHPTFEQLVNIVKKGSPNPN
ncbi:hypothetical protein CDL15_Pgr009806 [Punica granatum]|nr:hypothetical protein CDL15_Pgr009806 [Punica granatum]